MFKSHFMPEGSKIHTTENTSYISSLAGIERAMREGKILESNVIMCDEELNLHVNLFGIKGIIPKEECVLSVNNEPIKDIAIITRVGKTVCFKVQAIKQEGDSYVAILSRKEAQEECCDFYLSSLAPGDILPAAVTHLDNFGAFVDIGCGVISLLSIDCISVSRISHPRDRLYNGQRIFVAVKSNDRETGRIYVTMKELLGTWKENAAEFSTGQTVSGIVRSIESYGVFVELAPNLAGLAELRDDDPVLSDLQIGDEVSVYIKSILTDRMKIKLILIDKTARNNYPTAIRYYIDPKTVNRLEAWKYSPEGCQKRIETIFYT